MRAGALYTLFYICKAADAKIRAEVAALGSTQLKIGLVTWGYWEDAKGSKYRSPRRKWKPLTGAPWWWTGDKGARPSPQTLSLQKQLQRKAVAPPTVPTTQTQLSTGEVINVSKEDDQGNKCTLTAFSIEDIGETPPAGFRDLPYPLWVVNADLFVENESAGCVPECLFHGMMLGKELISYGDTDVVYRSGRHIQKPWRIQKERDQTTVPFSDAWLPVYS